MSEIQIKTNVDLIKSVGASGTLKISNILNQEQRIPYSNYVEGQVKLEASTLDYILVDTTKFIILESDNEITISIIDNNGQVTNIEKTKRFSFEGSSGIKVTISNTSALVCQISFISIARI